MSIPLPLRVIGAVLLSLGPLAVSRAQPADHAGEPTAGLAARVSAPVLVRCTAGRVDPCLRALVSLPFEQAVALSAGSGGRNAGWSARLAGRSLAAPTVEVPHDIAPCLDLLVLADVSGSMMGPRMQLVRDTLQAWIARLPRRCVRVGVAPFSSIDVASRVAGARLTVPELAAADVSALPEPSGNTGLYSALAAGARRLASDAEATPSAARRALLVVTDGVNDVDHPGDDPRLLDDVTGPRVAVQAIRGSGAHLFVVRTGVSRDIADMHAITAGRGTAYAVGDHPGELSAALADIEAHFRPARVLTFPLTAAQHDRLGARAAELTLLHTTRADGAPIVVGTNWWRPPLIALPSFSPSPAGAIGMLDEARGTGQGRAILVRRTAIVASLATLLLALAFVAPTLVGEPIALVPTAARSERQAAHARSSTLPHALATPRHDEAHGKGLAAATASVLVNGIRSDVREAAPRRPSDVTAPGD